MVLTLFGENITYINEKSRNFDPCPSLKGSSTFPSVSASGLTDADMRTQTGVAYPIQVNGILPFTDTGIRTWVDGHGQV